MLAQNIRRQNHLSFSFSNNSLSSTVFHMLDSQQSLTFIRLTLGVGIFIAKGQEANQLSDQKEALPS